jgi:hypothetical protein
VRAVGTGFILHILIYRTSVSAFPPPSPCEGGRVKGTGQSIHFVVAADVDQQYTAVIENPEDDAV